MRPLLDIPKCVLDSGILKYILLGVYDNPALLYFMHHIPWRLAILYIEITLTRNTEIDADE